MMIRSARLISSVAILLAMNTFADVSLLTLDRIFKDEAFKGPDWGPAHWLEDGKGYTVLEKSATVTNVSEIVRIDLESGTRDILVAASDLAVPGEAQPLKIEDYACSEDGTKFLLYTNTKRVWRKETRGDYWLLDLKSKALKKLGGKAEPSTLMFATLSPDATRVAYVCKNNLYVQSLDNLKITALTKDGSDTIINGTADWVYEEEFFLRNGFRWSPDGKHIAYWQFDASGVRKNYLVNNTDELYPVITAYAYPKVGQTNSACRVGVVKASGGKTHWFRPSDDPRNHYIPKMEWAEDSKSVVFQQLNRLQNTNVVFRGEVRNGELTPLLTDRDDAWVDVSDTWQWLDQGNRFLWLSDRGDWQQLYAASATNEQLTLLTPGAFDVVSVCGIDEKRGDVYFIASPDNPTQRYLYRAPLDGRGVCERLSPKDQPGTHGYDLSKDGRWAFHTYSAMGQPPRVELVKLPEHTVVRPLSDTTALNATLAALKPCPAEFFRVEVAPGVACDAYCLKPPAFDASKKYPLLLHVYGEPAGSTVTDKWGGETYLYHRMLAQEGYVVMSIDTRGTQVPRGRAYRKSIYRQVGTLAAQDQAAAVRQLLKMRPYLDPERVGVWGWSGGGSMSLNGIFRYPELYRTAIAIAFVCNQLFYDTIYQERYMGLPWDNAEGYKNGSPITYAHQLKGNVLLIYGTGDDNCHYKNFETLVNELITHNKLFSTMPYPNRSHSIKEGENTKRHLYGTMMKYLKQNLPTNDATKTK